MTRIRIKELSFQDQQTSLYHLHGVIESTSDECKSLTKISMHNLSWQFPQTSTHFGHNKIWNLTKFSCWQTAVCIIGGESRGIRISSRNNERSNRTNGNNGRFNRHLRIGFVSNLILFTLENYYKFRLQYKIQNKITTSFGYNTKIQNPSRYFNVSGNIIK